MSLILHLTAIEDIKDIFSYHRRERYHKVNRDFTCLVVGTGI